MKTSKREKSKKVNVKVKLLDDDQTSFMLSRREENNMLLKASLPDTIQNRSIMLEMSDHVGPLEQSLHTFRLNDTNET